MEEKINNINKVIAAFESRNELLHEEIKKNENAMKEMQEELSNLIENSTIEDSQLKMVS